MAPLLKNAPELSNSTPQPAGQPRADHLGADAVSLDVPIKVHGSRVTEIVRGATPHTEPFEEMTSTMIVFPQGGVLRMATPVNVGQMLVLTNLKSSQDAICRVVKVRTYSNLAGYVEVEFTHSHPGYWGVEFAPDELSLLKPPVASPSDFAAPPEVPAANAPAAKASDTLALPGAPKSAPSLTAPAKRDDTSFISIGSQEEVQPSASITRVAKLSVVRKEAPLPVPALATVPEIKPPASQPPIAAASLPVTPVAPVLSSQQTVESSPIEARSENLDSASPLSPAPAASTFGSGFSSAPDVYGEESKKSPLNWRVLAAAAGLALVLGGGGFFLMHSGAAQQNVATNSAPSSAPAAQIDSTAPAAQPAAPAPASAVNRAPQPKSALPAPAESRASKQSPAEEDARGAQAQTAKSEPAPKSPAKYISNVTSDLFGTLNAHPVAGSRHDQNPSYEPAPEANLSASNETGNALPGVSGSIAVAAPAADPGQPIQIKRQVVQPRLLSSVLPVYPAAARAIHAQGDVVLQIQIDERGNVTDAKPVSGPLVLRQSAMDAARKWKYDPSTVNGKAAASQLLVTLRFNI